MPEAKSENLLGKALLLGLFLHLIIVVLAPLTREARLIIQDMPLLWGKTNEERRAVMFGGKLDLVEDHEFIARCTREIPVDADVLIVSNSMGNVYILNYYLYPRKTAVDRDDLEKIHWTVHYYSPKALEMNRIEEPKKDGAFN